VSSTVGLTRCYKTEGFYAFILHRGKRVKTFRSFFHPVTFDALYISYSKKT